MRISGFLFCGWMLAAGFGTAATAATIDFAQGNIPQAGPLTFSNGSDSVSVSAVRLAANGSFTTGTALIASYAGNAGGLGICTSSYSATATGGCDTTLAFLGVGDSDLIDGYGSIFGTRPELALLSFGTATIDLLSITFNSVGDGDNFSVASDASPAYANYTIAAGAAQRTFTFATPLRGSLFGIGAFGANDDFRIRSIVYNIVNQPQVPTVPLPATGLLLVAALGGAMALRRRRRVA